MDQVDSVYINIGTEKACLFLNVSRQLVNVLKQNPFLYFAVEESLLSAKEGWYAVGIIAYAQILKTLNHRQPMKRHEIAHQLLLMRPSKKDYDDVLNELKSVAKQQCLKEFTKAKDKEKYREELFRDWELWVYGIRKIAMG